MQKFFQTDGKPMTIGVRVLTSQPQKIRIVVADAKKKHADYINRWCMVDKRQDFFLRLPLVPKNGYIMVYNEKTGNKKNDTSFKVLPFVKTPLERKLKAFNQADPVIANFVKFAQEFSEDAGTISAGGSVYTSDNGDFIVEYMDDITDRKTGRTLNTPARISQDEGRIQISRNKFLKYTIPMRMIILLHEFSHFYLNKDMANETEADLNALLIYLGLGYPRFEAFQAFKTVFYNAPSKGNKERMETIMTFINDFEKNKMRVQYNNSLN